MILFESSGRRHGARVDVLSRCGHDIVVLENRLVRVAVSVSKGADIVELRHKSSDLDMLWDAPQVAYPLGDYVPPAPGSPFLDYFSGGWQEILPNGGAPCIYEGAALGQHGEVALLPWRAELISDTPERVEVAFSVRTHRTPFRLERRMALDGDRATIEITEEVVNEGRQTLHYMWGHHPGFGPPFLEPGAILELPGGTVSVPARPSRPGARLGPGASSTWPWGTGTDGKRVDLSEFPPLDSHADDDFHIEELPESWAALRNPRLGLGVALEWDPEAYPYVWVWIVSEGHSGYPYFGGLVHVAIEPFSSPIGSLVENIQRGTAPLLHPGERATATLSATIFQGAGRVTSVKDGVVSRSPD